MKKKYNAPSMEIEKFTIDYVMTASSGGGIEEGGDEIGGNSNTNSLVDF